MARSSGRKPLIAGNWKMNLTHLEAIGLVQKIAFGLREREAEEVEVAVLPPFTALRSVQTLIEGDKLPLVFGGQDLSTHSSGAYTGEIAGAMLAKLGCTYVTVGHSERRQYHGEDDVIVAAKARAAYDSGLVPIICVGESESVREEQRHVAHVVESLTGCLADVARRARRGARRPSGHCLRAGLGHRHRQDRHRGRRAGNVPGPAPAAGRIDQSRARPSAPGCSTAVR